jgi:hypothetical protein
VIDAAFMRQVSTKPALNNVYRVFHSKANTENKGLLGDLAFGLLLSIFTVIVASRRARIIAVRRAVDNVVVTDR